MEEYVDIEIRKPLYSNFVYIRDKYIIQATKEHKKLRIKTPFGTGIMTVTEFLKDSKKMSKVFKMPDHPMILYGNFVPFQHE